MSYDAGELNRFFGSRLWRDITEDLTATIDDTMMELLEATEPITIGRLQGRLETLRNMVQYHKKYLSETDAQMLIDQLDNMIDGKSGFIEGFTPFEDMVQSGGEE